METIEYGNPKSTLPTIHVISDSVGVTGTTVARAAAAQFGETQPRVEILPNVASFEEVVAFLDAHAAEHAQLFGNPEMIVFYSIVEPDIRTQLHAYFSQNPQFAAVDLLDAPLWAVQRVSGREPARKPGATHQVDRTYFRRIDAMEFTINHDDGRNPQDLSLADIVLLGVSRCGKTPTSIYLSQEGYRVANVPLDPKSTPPKEIYDVEPTRLFGLMTTPDVLVGIRRRRLGNAAGVAASYADPLEVADDLDAARNLMRQLGCIVIHTENRAVEETAQEILRYYEMAHPRSA